MQQIFLLKMFRVEILFANIYLLMKIVIFISFWCQKFKPQEFQLKIG